MKLICVFCIMLLDILSASDEPGSDIQQQIRNLKVIFNHELEFLKKIIWIDLTGDIDKLRREVLNIKGEVSKMSVKDGTNRKQIDSKFKEDRILDALRKEKYTTRNLRQRNIVLQSQMDNLMKEITLISSFKAKFSDELNSIRKFLNHTEPYIDWLQLYKNEIQELRNFRRPSFISPWLVMKSQDDELSEVTVEHGLGILPYKVDVLVRPIDGPNAGWIFHGDSAFRNDDDKQPTYGGVVYMYDETKVTLKAPKKSNNAGSGRIIFTGSQDSRRLGNNHQKSDTALVRVKVWSQDDLPIPDFQSEWLPLNIENSSLAFYEIDHGLNEYPSLVNVQVMNEKTGLISEGVSSSVVPRPWLNAGGTIWGFNNQSVRIWSACNLGKTEGNVYFKPIGGGDGWGKKFLSDLATNTAKVKVMAWSKRHIRMNQNLFTGTADPKKFEFGPIDSRTKPTEADILTFFVEATNGPNQGYRFKGYGSSQAKEEGFGGSVFAFNNDGMVRAWPPNPTKNGHLIHIISPYGNGKNVQTSDDAAYVYNMIKTWP